MVIGIRYASRIPSSKIRIQPKQKNGLIPRGRSLITSMAWAALPRTFRKNSGKTFAFNVICTWWIFWSDLERRSGVANGCVSGNWQLMQLVGGRFRQQSFGALVPKMQQLKKVGGGVFADAAESKLSFESFRVSNLYAIILDFGPLPVNRRWPRIVSLLVRPVGMIHNK